MLKSPGMAVSRLAGALALCGISFLCLYGPVLVRLADDWMNDDNYSHGFLIVPLAAYLVWERRARLSDLPVRPSNWGLVLAGGSFLVLLAGILGAELFLSRIALIGSLGGGVLFVLGWQHLRILRFPLLILLLMIPIPTILFNQVALPLQLVASRVGVETLSAVGVPVLREGNIIVLAQTSLEVAEACSGIRSLISLLTLGIVYGYFSDGRTGFRAGVALATVPVAILANGLRVAGTGLAAHYYGAAAAEGFFHTFSGWVVFIIAFVFLFAVARLLLWLLPAQGQALDASVSVA